jgi:hypothetical protein
VAVRTLPLRPEPIAGEAIDSWLEFLAHRYDVTWSEFRRALGSVLPKDRYPDRWVFRLTDDQLRVISESTGVQPVKLKAMTLESYPPIASGYNSLTGQVVSKFPWRHVHASRFCPRCLEEDGGRWQIAWRMVWFFACPKHQCLLAELCPECSAPQRSFITASLIPRPGRCWAPVGESDRRLIGSRCAADLSVAPFHELAEDHPAISAQSTISQAILDNSDFGIYQQLRAPLPEILADLRALGGWFLSQAGRTGMEALIPEGLAAACVDRGEAVRMPVSYMLASASPAASTAAALTAAMAILSRPDVDSAAQLLASVLGSASKAPLADRINRRGQRPALETSDGLRAVLIAASDTRLRNTTQLRNLSGTAVPRRPSRNSAALKRLATRIPTMFWPTLTLRLVEESNTLRAARPALSAALLMVGHDTRVEEAIELLRSPQSPPAMTMALGKIAQSSNWTDIRHALYRLSDYLRVEGCPIDYKRRRELSLSQLLPKKEWEAICERTGTRVEGHSIARWFLAERISGTQVPLWSGFPSESKDYASALRFPLRLTPELSQALATYSLEFLAAQGIVAEPPQWRPPAALFAGLELPSRGTESIDVNELHRLVNLRRRVQIPLREIPERLGTNIERTRILCEEFPAPRVPRGQTVDEAYPPANYGSLGVK